MSERPRNPSLFVPLLVASSVLSLGFGGGVLVGRATRERRLTTTEKSEAPNPISAEEAKKELATCRRELAVRKKARATPPALLAPPPGEMDDAGLETAAKIEALQKKVDECRVSETLLNADVCGTFGDHINILFVILDSTQCREEAGLENFLASSLKQCAEFDDFPAHLDRDKLTREEDSRIAASMSRRDAAVRTKNYAQGIVQELRRRCRKTWALPAEE